MSVGTPPNPSTAPPPTAEKPVKASQNLSLAFLREKARLNDAKAMLQAGKDELAAIRERANERIGKLRGKHVARLMSDEMDVLVKAVFLFHRLRARLEEKEAENASKSSKSKSKNGQRSRAARRGGSSGGDIALMAVGGYGRRQMHLHSDVDIQFLVSKNISKGQEEFIGKVLRTLHDIGMDLGAVVRTLPECLAFLGRDIKSVTALLDLHFLAGKRSLMEELDQKFHAQIREGGKNHAWFVEALQESVDKRHEDHGGSEYILEPNIKEGQGGLRDHHNLRWWLSSRRNQRTLRELHDDRVISSADLQRIEDSYNFLATLRGHLHRLAGRKADTLIFTYQEPVARAMRFRDAEGQLAQELLMREYYIHAHRMRFIMERLRRELSTPARQSIVGKVVSRFTDRKIAPYFIQRGGKLYVDDRKLGEWKSDETAMMRLFLKTTQMDIPLGGGAIERARVDMADVDPEEFQRLEYNREAFLKILGAPQRVAEALRAMRDCGVLSGYLPEFEHLICLVRADQYHKYTVDEHTFKTIEAAEALLRDDPSESHMARIARRIDRWPYFILALLLHDIGKGLGPGHALRGGTMTARISERMDLGRADAEFVKFLVTEHLKYSHLALQRDVSDPKVARELISVVETRERLDALYVLTYCDMRGVAPGLWTSWNAQLFEELYERTAQLMEVGRIVEEDILSIPVNLHDNVAKFASTPKDDKALTRFIESVPPRYLAYTPEDQIAEHFKLIKAYKPDDPIQWTLLDDQRYDRTILAVCGPDLPGLFHLLTHALASKKLSIQSAQCLATDEGLVLDQFSLRFKDMKLSPDFRMERLRQSLKAVLLGDKTEEEAFGEQPALDPPDPQIVKLAPTKVKVDNDASDRWTVCEIKSHDRPGLLSAIGRVFVDAGLYIHQAIIRTEAYRVVDVFYLSTLDNNKLTDRTRIKRLEKQLLELLDPESASLESK